MLIFALIVKLKSNQFHQLGKLHFVLQFSYIVNYTTVYTVYIPSRHLPAQTEQ